MLDKIEKRILDFAKDTGLTDRREMVHGTLYVKLHEEKECDTFHKAIRTFYKEQINNEGGVNMYAVGDEFAFDFVPEDREAPVFVEPYSGETTDIDDQIKGVWSEFAEEEMLNNLDEDDLIEAQAEIQMQLEAESKRGK